MTTPDEEMLQNLALMEGMLLGQRLVLAMLIHASRSSLSFDEIYREIRREYQPFTESVLTLHPQQRVFFLGGNRAGLESTLGMADAIAEIMDALGHG